LRPGAHSLARTFWIACALGPGTAGLVLVLWALYGPGQVRNWWAIPLFSVLLFPLYFARRSVDRRINDVKQRLEQAETQGTNDEHESI